jgi:hypothetical protein
MSRVPGRKRTKPVELRPEYELAELLSAGVRGKHLDEYRRGTNLVLLDPDVASAFEDDAAVNEALRLALKLADLPRGRKVKRSDRVTAR